MKVKIRTNSMRVTLPVPVGMAAGLINLLPEAILERIKEELPKPYQPLITKPNLKMLLDECTTILKENKGLDVVHVEGADGTLVHIRL